MDFLTNALTNSFLAGYMHCAVEHNVMTEEEFINELKKSGWNDFAIDSVKSLYKLIVKNNAALAKNTNSFMEPKGY